MSRAAEGQADVTPARRPRRLAALTLALAILTAGGAATWYVVKPARERREALRLSREGAFADAEPVLRQLAERDGRDGEVLRALALGTLDAHRNDEAEAYLERWRALQPGEKEPEERLMQLLVRQVRVAMTLERAERTDEPDAEAVDAQRREILSLLAEGRHADAERRCRQHLTRRPGSPALRALLAEACHAQGKGDEARNLLDPLLRARPDHKDALLSRAVLFLEDDQPDQAVPLLRRVLSRDPGHTAARNHLGQALARAGHTAEAEKEMAELVRRTTADNMAGGSQVQPDNLEMQIKVAEALRASGRSDEGLRLLRRVLARQPDHAGARRALSSGSP